MLPPLSTNDKQLGEPPQKRPRVNTVRIAVSCLYLDCTVIIEATSSTPVIRIKEKIHSELGVHPRWQKLIFLGQELDDDAALGAVGVTEDATFFLVQRQP